MLNWFSREDEGVGMERLRAEFGQMLDAGRHVFDIAANAFLGGTDPEVIRKDLFSTDKRINKSERRIRRELVVHATIHGVTHFPGCLVLMSLVKDAERVGDYSKNLFELALQAPAPPSGEHLERLIKIKDELSRVLASCREIFDSQDEEAAKLLIRRLTRLEEKCDKAIDRLIGDETPDQMSVTYALAYRYLKRVASHVRNVTSSIVQPLHKLDFTTKLVKKMKKEEKREKRLAQSEALKAEESNEDES
jgi:phosphate transport system protein